MAGLSDATEEQQTGLPPLVSSWHCSKSTISGPECDVHALARRVSRIADGNFRILPPSPFSQ